MSKKTLAFYLPSLVGGGAERVTLNLVQYLAKHHDYQIDLVLVSATGELMHQVPDNVRVIDLESTRMLTSMPKLIKYLKKEKPHAILAGMDYVNVIALTAVKLARTKTRTVACLHINLTAQLANPVLRRAKYVVPFIKLTHPWANSIVATSRGCGEDFLKVTGVGKKNMHLIYNPTITDSILPKSQESVDHPWLTNNDTPVILAVGRLVQQKNFELAIRALAEVRKTREARLLILGDGPKRAELEALAEELGVREHVDMPGFVENPYAYMSKVSMLLMSSRFEALPAVLIEALHIGTQIVSTDCPNGPEEILENGKYGELIPMHDEKAMAQAIEKTLDNVDFKRHDEACQRYIAKHVTEQYLKVLIGPDSEMADLPRFT